MAIFSFLNARHFVTPEAYGRMRDERLYPLFAPLTSVKGIGPKLSDTLERLIGGHRILDLLFHLPERYVDRTPKASFDACVVGEIATVRGTVTNHSQVTSRNAPVRIRLQDHTGFLTLVYFHANARFLQGQFPMNKDVIVSGKVDTFANERQILHPDYVVQADSGQDIPEVEAVYPLTAGLTNQRLGQLIRSVLDALPDLPDWTDPALRDKQGWPEFAVAVRTLHAPASAADPAIASAARRLAYDEALSREVTFALARHTQRARPGVAIPDTSQRIDEIIAGLPFHPTGAQEQALGDIRRDMKTGNGMRRMIQGDVGSGKSLVAALAAAHVVQAGHQVAIMAPTEVLARQLFATFESFLADWGISCAFLSGRMPAGEKSTVLEGLASGKTEIVAGTHALFQDAVTFDDLGLVIIDEQHRFGVSDRAKLSSKGRSPHLLVMSATPIPRTLAMSINGDLDVSILDEKPAGRRPVSTSIVAEDRLMDVIGALGGAIDRGEKAFWVCPRVDAEDDDASAVARHAALNERFLDQVVLVHGRMSSADKESALAAFRDTRARILVATTVIEVGVDVPDATIMIIERAEKFGLAQLHQLRGRVGRGEKPSSCLLIYTPPLTANGRKRLDVLRKSDDGFEIAEADFKLRGPGDILGFRQSGLPDLRFIDLHRDTDLLETARQDARLLITKDPDLASERGQAVRVLRDLLGQAALVASRG